MYPMNRMYRTLLATVALAFSSVAASAETITVCASGCDYTSINAAIGAASDGDIIQLAAETYFEGSQIDTLGKAITLRGVLDRAGDPASVLDGGGTHRVLICQSGETAETVFENLVIQNGYSDFYGGGMYNVGASPTLANCTFEGNSADNGGGMYNELGTATLVGCVFLNNSAIRDGGGVYNLGGNIVATDSIFEANSAGLNAGGVVLVGGVSTFDACEFFANSSTAGGAIYANDFSVVTIRNSVIRGNTTITDGGGLFAYTATVRFEQCQIQENSAGRGGAAFNLASSVVLEATFACDNGVDQFYGGYDDLGANCVSEECGDDLDGNGIPDTCEPCLGDITGNGVVDAADLGILLALWNTDGKSAPEADINGDGTVNAADLGLLLGAWGPCP